MFGMEVTGAEEVEAMFAELSSPRVAASVSKSAVNAGVKVMRNAGVRASPGRVKLEWGQRITVNGTRAVGEVGLGVGGYRGSVKRPHGIYLDQGTQYISARHFVATAFAGARQRAEAAMKRVARSRINRIVESHR